MGKSVQYLVLLTALCGCAPTDRGPGSVSDWRGPTWEDWIIRRNDPWNLPDDTVGTAVWQRERWGDDDHDHHDHKGHHHR
ncbi:MAG: hypothetical protein ACK5O7_03685 [Holosporales bacterium]